MCNQPNYARWTVKYSDNLQKVAQSHPDLFEQFQNGFFLALKELINLSQSNQLTWYWNKQSMQMQPGDLQVMNSKHN